MSKFVEACVYMNSQGEVQLQSFSKFTVQICICTHLTGWHGRLAACDLLKPPMAMVPPNF